MVLSPKINTTSITIGSPVIGNLERLGMFMYETSYKCNQQELDEYTQTGKITTDSFKNWEKQQQQVLLKQLTQKEIPDFSNMGLGARTATDKRTYKWVKLT